MCKFQCPYHRLAKLAHQHFKKYFFKPILSFSLFFFLLILSPFLGSQTDFIFIFSILFFTFLQFLCKQTDLHFYFLNFIFLLSCNFLVTKQCHIHQVFPSTSLTQIHHLQTRITTTTNLDPPLPYPSPPTLKQNFNHN